MFKDLFKGNEENLSGELRVVGDRASGKTTYLAALARWPQGNPSSQVEAVTATNEDGEELLKMAQNILEQGEQLEQTTLADDVVQVKNYGLRIVMKKQSARNNPKASINLDINCKDYAGEFFSDLLKQSGVQQLKEYIEDCALARGLLLLIDATAHRQDSEYAEGIDKLLIALDRASGDREQKQKRRIALVLSKCELTELWHNRDRPRWLAEARFRQLYEKLETWQRLGSCEVDYFTVSAFGVLGNKFPRPNSKQITRDRRAVASVLENPKMWRPFGLVSPIYWLCTGVHNTQLDKD